MKLKSTIEPGDFKTSPSFQDRVSRKTVCRRLEQQNLFTIISKNPCDTYENESYSGPKDNVNKLTSKTIQVILPDHNTRKLEINNKMCITKNKLWGK